VDNRLRAHARGTRAHGEETVNSARGTDSAVLRERAARNGERCADHRGARPNRCAPASTSHHPACGGCRARLCPRGSGRAHGCICGGAYGRPARERV